MKERPILFSGPMVSAILEGRKTQIRRVIDGEITERANGWLGWYSKRHSVHCSWSDPEMMIKCEMLPRCPYGKPGDHLWVKESFYCDHVDYADGGRLGGDRPDGVTDDMMFYPAEAKDTPLHWCCQLIPECQCAEIGKTKARSGRFMPRWASRINLEITGVRVERLDAISRADAKAEGIQSFWDETGRSVRGIPGVIYPKPNQSWSEVDVFRNLWDKINGKKHPWSSNPWLWCIEFKKI